MVYTYDTATSEVWDENGELQLAQFTRADFVPSMPFDRSHNPNKKGKLNNLLEISLGFNCNFKCEYCSQNLLKNKAYSSTPKDVEPFIEQLKQSGLDPQNIQLWGGEPLVYWKVLLLLIPALRSLYPDTLISLTTNGSLLTREKIDFLNKYAIHLYVSHDGPINDYRDKDVLKDPVVMDALRYSVKTYGPRSIQFGNTLGHNNTDVVKVAEFFNRLFDQTDYEIGTGVHNIVRCHDSKDLNQVLACTLTEEDLTTYTNTIFEVLNSPDKNYYGCRSLVFKLERAIDTLIQKEPIEAVRAECCMPFSDGLLTDMKGNILTCHNHATQEYKCGTLSDLSSVHATGYNFWANKKRCRECPYIHWCKGGCPSADDKANKLACPNLQALYKGLMMALFGRLFGIYITKIEKV